MCTWSATRRAGCSAIRSRRTGVRRSIASIVTFGSPVDTLAALPMGLPPNLAPGIANFMADHVFNRLDIPSWLARTGFQMLDPLKTAKARVDFVRQLHDREALLPREAAAQIPGVAKAGSPGPARRSPSCSSSSSRTTG